MFRVLLAVWIGAFALLAAARAGDGRPAFELDAAIESAFDAAFNLDHDRALAEARRALSIGPGESRAHRTLAAILWIDLLFQRGALSVDHYLGGMSRAEASRFAPTPTIDAEFRAELAKAIDLANARLARNANDVGARYDLGAAHGIQASYTASVNGSFGAAFRSAKRAYDAQEEVLEREPSRVAAGVIVGTYRYLVSVLNMPSRMFVYMVGFGGGKERGILLLRTAAAAASDTQVEAKTALVLILSREGRHAEVVQLLAELEQQFPRNRLLTLERGAASIRAGRFAEAEATLRRGWGAFEHDSRRKLPGERALWRYKMGLARLGQYRTADAAADFQAAIENAPTAWVRARAHLALGHTADLAGRREQALQEYRRARDLGRAASDPWCAVRAERFLKRPFTTGVAVG